MNEAHPGHGEVERSGEPDPTTVRGEWTAAESLPNEVVDVVAVATSGDPREMEPLYDTLDPDALSALFDSPGRDREGASEATVSFRYAGCHVSVHGDGGIVVTLS